MGKLYPEGGFFILHIDFSMFAIKTADLANQTVIIIQINPDRVIRKPKFKKKFSDNDHLTVQY